jgi:hypothetical protein
MTLAWWQAQMDGYKKSLAEQKQLLAKINRGQLPTKEDVSVIDFDNEHYCSLNSSCNERKIPKRQLMALYKRKTIEHIGLTEQSIAELMEKKPTETPGHHQPARPQRQVLTGKRKVVGKRQPQQRK